MCSDLYFCDDNAQWRLVNRLSENPDVKVGLIEAGVLHSEDDPVVYMPRAFAGPGNPDYDWVFATEPQANAQGRVIPAPRYVQGRVALVSIRLKFTRCTDRGKMLGGSTGINYMGWHRASKIEYDAWKLLSDPEGAWDSDEMFFFLKRAEAAVPASENQDMYTSFSRSRDDVVNHGIPRSEVVGTEGPVKVCVGL